MPGARTTSTTLYVLPPSEVAPAQYRIPATSPAACTTPSLTRNPAARSKSSPGVRIVTVSGRPPTLISIGSSAASVSGR